MSAEDHSPGRDHRREELSSALANRYCRYVLSFCTESSDAVASVADLSAAIARTNDRPDTTTVAIQLHHSDLPRLDDVGVVDYDARSKTVRYRGHPQLEDSHLNNTNSMMNNTEPSVEGE